MGKQKKTKKLRKKKGIKILCIFLLFSLSLFVFAVLNDKCWRENETLPNHVSLFGRDLSGLSFAAAEEIIKDLLHKRSETSIQLVSKAQVYTYTCGELGFSEDPGVLLRYAESLGREGNLLKRYEYRIGSLWRETELETAIVIDEDPLSAALDTVKGDLTTTAKNACFYIDAEGNVAVNPSEKGTFLNSEATAKAIRKALADPAVSEVELIIDENADPDITTADLEAMEIDGVLSTFTTYYSEGAANRAHNIALAVSFLDLTLIPAEGSFSFNETVGQRSYERGFLDAVIIENGEYTDGLGGGVCQVSTTVYGALLRTELTVTARRPHSLISSYVDPGQDAMVAWGTSDLAFENTYPRPVLLHATAENGVLTVTIYGNTALKKDITVTSNIIRYIPYTTETIIDDDLSRGSRYIKSPGKQGLECSVSRTIAEDGAVLTSETVSHDTYMAQKEIIVAAP
ncbi:MAG TPA: VanW family protein [Clostridiales bacterium]|nr:VanW family protein [Clostridiales bacterium]